MEWLNQYSGLFSLIAMIASIVAVLVAIYIYKKQKSDDRHALIDEYLATKDIEEWPYGFSFGTTEKQDAIRKRTLERRLKIK